LNKVIKIFIVVMIVLGVCCVWFLKNIEKSPAENTVLENQSILVEEEKSTVSEVSLPPENEIKLQREVQSNKVHEEIDKEEKKPEKQNPVEVKKETVLEPTMADEKSSVSEELYEEKNVVEVVEGSQDEILTEEDIISELVMPELVATEFDLEKLKSYKLPIMIEFGASWCTWCRWMEPTLEELNKEFAGKVVIQSVDVEKFRDEVSDFDVSLLPTIYFFDAEGNVVETRVGAMMKDDILKVFESMGVKND